MMIRQITQSVIKTGAVGGIVGMSIGTCMSIGECVGPRACPRFIPEVSLLCSGVGMTTGGIIGFAKVAPPMATGVLTVGLCIGANACMYYNTK